MTPDVSKILPSVIDIAVDAGDAILKIYSRETIESTRKEDSSPLTEADMASHNLILERLSSNFSYPVLSEEDPIEYETRKSWDIFWLVDPLDGTKNFIAKDDQFTVNIALVDGVVPVLGVVHVPALNITYYGAKGCGAFRRDHTGDHPLAVSRHRNGSELLCATSTFHDNENSTIFCSHYGIINHQRFGSSLKVCKVAEGAVDVYPRLNGTKEWDTAAPHCILNEAGGKMIDVVTKEELVYNKEDYRNNYFIASREDLHFDWPVGK